MGDFNGTIPDHRRTGHEAGVEKREVARRLKIDVKTVRRILRKIAAGAKAPERASPGSKLDPFMDRIRER